MLELTRACWETQPEQTDVSYCIILEQVGRCMGLEWILLVFCTGWNKDHDHYKWGGHTQGRCSDASRFVVGFFEYIVTFLCLFRALYSFQLPLSCTKHSENRGALLLSFLLGRVVHKHPRVNDWHPFRDDCSTVAQAQRTAQRFNSHSHSALQRKKERMDHNSQTNWEKEQGGVMIRATENGMLLERLELCNLSGAN